MMATQNDPPTTGEEREEDGVVEVGQRVGVHHTQVITQYAKNIARSLKDAVTHTVDAGRQASDSLAELQSQNENLSRIKHCLNESHKTVSATQKIVDTYVNSVRWISSSIPWQRATELSSDKATSESTSIVAKLPSYWSTSFWTTKDEAEAPEVGVTDPIKQALGDLSSTATGHLDVLIDELKSNRAKTELIATTVQQQNRELERISESAVALQGRVSQVNRVLRDNT